MKVRQELVGVVKSLTERREQGFPKEPGMRIGTHRVDMKHLEHLTFEATTKGAKEFKLIVDEPPDGGGLNTGPRPLQYFVLGAGSCLLMQCARLAISRDISMDSLETTALGHIDRKIGGGFRDMIFDIRIGSKEGKERIIQLVRDAEQHCFVHNTLKRATDLTTNLYLNGDLVATLKPEQA